MLALGYAGWSAGQLESEIQANGWLHCPADLDLVFDPDLEGEVHAGAGQDRHRPVASRERRRSRLAAPELACPHCPSTVSDEHAKRLACVIARPAGAASRDAVSHSSTAAFGRLRSDFGGLMLPASRARLSAIAGGRLEKSGGGGAAGGGAARLARAAGGGGARSAAGCRRHGRRERRAACGGLAERPPPAATCGAAAASARSSRGGAGGSGGGIWAAQAARAPRGLQVMRRCGVIGGGRRQPSQRQ